MKQKQLVRFVAAVLALGSCVEAPSHARGSVYHRSKEARLLDKEMPRLLSDLHVKSVSFATIKGGRITNVAAYGAQSTGVPATTGTLYNIASLTKPLTAEIILQLASKGRVSLDEPMDRYWSDPDLTSDHRRELLTPRLALSHQTGFPNWRNAQRGLAFDRQPGTAWGYSGEGYQ